MERNSGLDFLKFISAFMVICIHVSFPGLVGRIWVPITRIAVPLFLMITGYYYSNTKNKHKEGKQLFKIFKLFLSANLLYFVYSIVKNFASGNTISSYLSEICTKDKMFSFIALNESPFGGHLWYLGAILYALLIIFVFEKIGDRKYLYYTIPFLLITDLALGKYSLLLFGKYIPYIFVRNFLFVGLPYFLIGDLLYKLKDRVNIKPTISGLLVVFFAFTTLLERYILGVLNLNAVRDHYISTTFLAVFAFLTAVQYKNSGNSKIYSILCYVGAALSTGIYVLHPMFIDLLKPLLTYIEDYTVLHTIYSYILPFVVLIFSILAAFAVRGVTKKLKRKSLPETK